MTDDSRFSIVMSILLGVQDTQGQIISILAQLKMKAYHQSGQELNNYLPEATVTFVLVSYTALVFKSFEHLANLNAF